MVVREQDVKNGGKNVKTNARTVHLHIARSLSLSLSLPRISPSFHSTHLAGSATAALEVQPRFCQHGRDKGSLRVH